MVWKKTGMKPIKSPNDKMSLVHPYRVELAPGQRHVTAIEGLAKMPMVGGKRAKLLIDGDQTFQSILEGIASAQDYVLMQFYIVRDDELGRRLQGLLQEKARQGVRVYFLYDEIGSYRLPVSFLSEMTTAGVEAHRFIRPAVRATAFSSTFVITVKSSLSIVIRDGLVDLMSAMSILVATPALVPGVTPT